MTQISLNALKTDFGVPGEEAATVSIVATPWAGDRPKIRVSGPKLILPDADALTFTGTTASETFILNPPDGSYCWKLDVTSQSPSISFTRYVTFADVPTIDWEDLTEVDPVTFSPTVDAEAAWWVAFNELESQLANSAPTFIQATPPVHDGPYTWWDTSTPDSPTLWIEDGVA